jgi:hypothetical protein
MLSTTAACPRPAGAGPLDLDRQAGDVKAVRPGDAVEVGQLLDLAVLPLDPGEVSRPDEAPVTSTPVIGHHVGEGPVQRVGVDADHLHLLLHQPEDAFPAQPRLLEVGGRAQSLGGPGV